MGGYASGLADAAAKMIAPVVDNIGKALEHSASLERVLNRTPESKLFVDSYHNTFVPEKSQYVSQTLKDEFASKRPDVTQRVDITKHPDYDPTFHKEADRTDPVSGKIIPGAPRTTGRIHPETGKIMSDKPINTAAIETEGTRLAREKWLGKGDVAGVYAAKTIEQRHGLAAAQSFSDSLAFLLRDNTKVITRSGGIKAQVPISTFKRNVIGAGVGLKDASPTFKPRTDLERAVTNWSYAAFSPLIAIPHIATFFNGMFGTDASTFLKGAFHSIVDGVGKNSDHWSALVDTGAMTDSMLRESGYYNKYVSSDRKFKLPNDSIIPKLYGFFHQPGFSYLRDMTLVSGGLTGQYTAEQVGRDFVQNPTNRRLLWQLKEFDLDPKKILEQGGKLDEDDKSKAIFKFVNKHYFVDNTLQRSMLLQASPTGRILGMYHGYVTRQAKLMSRAMFMDYRKRGMASVARNLAIGAVAFPMLGEGIKVTQEAIRGQNAGGDLSDDLDNVTLQNGTPKALETYFEMLGHVGAFGVYSNFVRGSLAHSLAQTALGPLGRAATDVVQDTASAAKRTVDTEFDPDEYQQSLAPLERDATYDIPGISLLANVLDHRVLPKKTEDPDNDPAKEVYDELTK